MCMGSVKASCFCLQVTHNRVHEPSLTHTCPVCYMYMLLPANAWLIGLSRYFVLDRFGYRLFSKLPLRCPLRHFYSDVTEVDLTYLTYLFKVTVTALTGMLRRECADAVAKCSGGSKWFSPSPPTRRSLIPQHNGSYRSTPASYTQTKSQIIKDS